MSTTTNNAHAAGTLTVYDAAGHAPEWSTLIGGPGYRALQVAVAQLDADPALEIVVGVEDNYKAQLKVFDGGTHAAQWESPNLGWGEPRALAIVHSPSDPIDSIAVGLNDYHVRVFHGATPVIRWDSGVLDGPIQDVASGDLDGNGVPDLAILTDKSLYLVATDSWHVLQRDFTNGTHVAIEPATSGPGRLLISSRPSEALLEAWAGDDYHLLWQQWLGFHPVIALAVADLTGDSAPEFAILGGNSATGTSVLSLGSTANPPAWLYDDPDPWNVFNSLAAGDFDHNGHIDFVAASHNVLREYRVDPPAFIPTPTPHPTATPTETATPTVTPTTPPTALPTATLVPPTAAPPTATPPAATATPCGLSFDDVHATDYFYRPVLDLACAGVISGYADGTFRPYNQTTRAQMVKIVVLGFGVPITTPPAGGQTFADVAPGSAFFAVIETAAADGIVSGYACGGPGEPCDGAQRPYFRPYANVTRGPAEQDRRDRRGLAAADAGRPDVRGRAGGEPVLPVRGDGGLPGRHLGLRGRHVPPGRERDAGPNRQDRGPVADRGGLRALASRAGGAPGGRPCAFYRRQIR